MTTSQGRDSRGGGRPGTRRFSGRRRRQCVCKEVGTIDYKDVSVLRRFINDRGRIESGRKAGNCAKCQRELSTAISRARHLALLPFAPSHLRVTGSIAQSAPASESEADESSDEESKDASEASTEESTEAAASVESSEEAASEESSDSDESADDSSEDEQPEAAAETEDSEDGDSDSGEGAESDSEEEEK